MVIICFSDYWKSRELFEIHVDPRHGTKIEPAKASYDGVLSKQSSDFEQSLLKRLKLPIDGNSVFYLRREILFYTELRNFLFAKAQRVSDTRHFDVILYFQIIPPKKEIIDYKWNQMLTQSLWQKIELDHLMSWLSTLGGGFSALGEQFTRCAETAGKISLKQFQLGLRLGDPFLQSRCKLYYSISLIQMKRLRSAKYILREQYKFAKTHEQIDGRLVKMCEGIWLRLQYEYSLRQKEREKRKSLPPKNGDKRNVDAVKS